MIPAATISCSVSPQIRPPHSPLSLSQATLPLCDLLFSTFGTQFHCFTFLLSCGSSAGNPTVLLDGTRANNWDGTIQIVQMWVRRMGTNKHCIFTHAKATVGCFLKRFTSVAVCQFKVCMLRSTQCDQKKYNLNCQPFIYRTTPLYLYSRPGS